jgi:hypothetical protein
MKAPAMMGGKAKDRKAYLRALAKIAVETGEAVKPGDNMIWKLANLCEIHPRMLDRLVKTARIIGVSEKDSNASREPEEQSQTPSTLE